MRQFSIGASVLAAALALILPVAAQTRVAPPAPVESQPLPPPPGLAAPGLATPVQTPPAAVPETPPGPTPVQPPPPAPAPVVPQPVQPAPAPAAPLEPTPVQPPPTLPPPTLPPPQQQATPPAPQQTGQPDPNATLAGRPGDPSDVDEIPLVAKPVLARSGQSSWDQGFEKLSESFRLLREEAARAGLPVAGRPLTLFVETDDNGFRFDAMLPVAGLGGGGPRPVFGNGVRAGQSPAGPSLRFVHNAPYDDIDSTYETITAYLEAKSIVAKDAFLEEYVTDLKDAGDPNLEINVYVQPR